MSSKLPRWKRMCSCSPKFNLVIFSTAHPVSSRSSNSSLLFFYFKQVGVFNKYECMLCFCDNFINFLNKEIETISTHVKYVFFSFTKLFRGKNPFYCMFCQILDLIQRILKCMATSFWFVVFTDTARIGTSMMI